MGGGRATATGGGAIPMFTCTPAIVGIGTTITNAKSTVPKTNFLIWLPPMNGTFWFSFIMISLFFVKKGG
jgi:hypothetical protein